MSVAPLVGRPLPPTPRISAAWQQGTLYARSGAPGVMAVRRTPGRRSRARAGRDLAVAPGMVLEGDDVVLQELDPLVSFEDGGLASGISEFQRGVIVEDLVHSLVCPWGQGAKHV
jgi:hypothetical protein